MVNLPVVVTASAIDPGALATEFFRSHPDAAVATFTGFVRDFNETSGVQALFLECYVEMAGKVLTSLGEGAASRFELKAWHIVHRFGTLTAKEPIVFVATSADHRAEAFSACEFIMDALKTDAPFWKQEHDGAKATWVSAKLADENRRNRWVEEDKTP